MLWAFLSHGNVSLTSENFKLISQRRVKLIPCPTSHYVGGCWRYRLVTKGVEVQRGLKFSVVESMMCGRELAARLEGSSAREPKCIRLFNTK